MFVLNSKILFQYSCIWLLNAAAVQLDCELCSRLSEGANFSVIKITITNNTDSPIRLLSNSTHESPSCQIEIKKPKDQTFVKIPFQSDKDGVPCIFSIRIPILMPHTCKTTYAIWLHGSNCAIFSGGTQLRCSTYIQQEQLGPGNKICLFNNAPDQKIFSRTIVLPMQLNIKFKSSLNSAVCENEIVSMARELNQNHFAHLIDVYIYFGNSRKRDLILFAMNLSRLFFVHPLESRIPTIPSFVPQLSTHNAILFASCIVSITNRQLLDQKIIDIIEDEPEFGMQLLESLASRPLNGCWTWIPVR
jgi:hypothetical protein